MNKLDVVNDMLASMGEVSINSLTEQHTMLGDCLRIFKRVDEAIQAEGWWFNREKLNLQPSALTSEIYVPGDTLAAYAPPPWAVRGRRLYNTSTGNYIATSAVDVSLIRYVPFEELPHQAAEYIAASAVAQFQANFDGDSSQEVKEREERGRRMIRTEHVRQVGANAIDGNVAFVNIRAMIRRGRPAGTLA